jgi:hypothetical protein
MSCQKFGHNSESHLEKTGLEITNYCMTSADPQTNMVGFEVGGGVDGHADWPEDAESSTVVAIRTLLTEKIKAKSEISTGIKAFYHWGLVQNDVFGRVYLQVHQGPQVGPACTRASKDNEAPKPNNGLRLFFWLCRAWYNLFLPKIASINGQCYQDVQGEHRLSVMEFTAACTSAGWHALPCL